MFVVLLTDDGQQLVGPRAVGPFEDWDAAQKCQQALVEQWNIEDGMAPTATVVRVEEPMTGVVVGEMQ